MSRPRKPLASKILEGTYRADRDGSPDSIVVAEGTPLPPAHLASAALDLWNAIVPGLVERKVAATCDSWQLSMMCEWLARYHKTSEALDKKTVASKGYYQLGILAGMCGKNFDRIACRFGLTAADRTRLRIEGAAKPKGVVARKRK